MPRIENAGPAVDEWCDRTGSGSSTFDLCNRCWLNDVWNEPAAQVVAEYPDLAPYNGEPVGETFEACGSESHPPYDDPDNYSCAICGRTLTCKDD